MEETIDAYHSHEYTSPTQFLTYFTNLFCEMRRNSFAQVMPSRVTARDADELEQETQQSASLNILPPKG